MFRKTVLGLTAGAALVTVALAPTAASAHYYGYKSYGYSYNYYKPHYHSYSYDYYRPSYGYKSYRYGY